MRFIAIFSHLPTISELVLPSLVTYLVLSDRATWPRDLDLTGNEQPRDGARIISFAGWRAHRVGDMLLVGVMTRGESLVGETAPNRLLIY